MSSNLRARKKNLPKSTNEMSKEMLIETLKKKKECNAKAMSIVEVLCETCPDEGWFLDNLGFINQSHFEDVIVERAITKICGYPLCKVRLENVPSKKYHISVKQNKVFDITERKNFCSSACYKAGMYLKNQLLTSPLWFRDQEVIPKFKLLPCSSSLSMGEEIVFFPHKERLKSEILLEKNREEKEDKKSDIEKVEERLRGVTLEGCEEPGEKDKVKDESKEIGCDISVKQDAIKGRNVTEKCVNEPREKVTDGGVKVKEKQIRKREEVIPVDPVKRVEQCIYEWFSFDTVLYLYGEDKVKDLLKDRKDEVKRIIGSKPLIPGCNERIDRMIKFYSLLDSQLFDSDSRNRTLKPLPDYTAIKDDGKKLEVKVRAFYSGQLEISQPDVIPEKKKEDEDGSSEIYLPPVDAHAQNSLRVKILLDRFNRVIPELIRTFTTASCFEISELRELVNHFTLSPHNITFKPGEWYLIGFIIIKLLSLKNRQLDSLLKSETGVKHVTLFLMNYGLPQDYLGNIVEWLMNADDLVKKLK